MIKSLLNVQRSLNYNIMFYDTEETDLRQLKYWLMQVHIALLKKDTVVLYKEILLRRKELLEKRIKYLTLKEVLNSD